MSPQDALVVLRRGISRLNLERLIRDTGGVYEHVYRTGEYRVRYACIDKPSGLANARKKDASLAIIGYVKEALGRLLFTGTTPSLVEEVQVPSKPRPLDSWVLEQVERDHEEAVRLNKRKILTPDQRLRADLKNLYRNEWYKQKKDDPVFREKNNRNTRAFRAKAIAVDPEYNARRAREYRERLEKIDPDLPRAISSVNNKKYDDRHKNDPEWRENKNRVNRESWRRKISEKDPEEHRLEHNRKAREYNAKKRAERAALAVAPQKVQDIPPGCKAL